MPRMPLAPNDDPVPLWRWNASLEEIRAWYSTTYPAYFDCDWNDSVWRRLRAWRVALGK